MKTTLFIISCFFCLNIQAKDKGKVVIYDLPSGLADTLYIENINSHKIADQTSYYIGKYSNLLNVLEDDIGQSPSYPGNNFTIKQKAQNFYDLTSFPLRTSIKIFKVEDGISSQKCSGFMVSSQHVLTAWHCTVKYREIDFPHCDSLWVSPAFDNGELNSYFGSAKVRRVYVYCSKAPGFEYDFALLELDKPIGIETGWIGFGYNDKDEFFNDKIFYKFSYPGISDESYDRYDLREFNGDTLYFNYGLIDIITPYYFSVNGAYGIPGESGSCLFGVENEEKYISYGVLSMSHNLMHSRIRKEVFYPFKEIIESYTQNIEDDTEIYLYPNPVIDLLSYRFPFSADFTIQLFNVNGQKIYEEQKMKSSFGEVDLSSFPKGTYILIIKSDNNKYVRKIIKQ